MTTPPPAYVSRSFLLGLRDGFNPLLALISLCITVFSSLLWLFIFLFWGHEIMQALLQGAGWLAHTVLGWFGVNYSLTPDTADPRWWARLSSWMLGWSLTILCYLLAVLLTIRLVVELFFIRLVQQHCLKRYPHLRTDIKRPLPSVIWSIIRGWSVFALLALVCLTLPIIGGALLFVLMSYFNVRSLANDAMDGLADEAMVRHLLRNNRMRMTGLGILLSLFALIPFIGLFLPAIIAAASCHLFMQQLPAAQLDPSPDSPA